jgi:hypothetical protein
MPFDTQLRNASYANNCTLTLHSIKYAGVVDRNVLLCNDLDYFLGNETPAECRNIMQFSSTGSNTGGYC